MKCGYEVAVRFVGLTQGTFPRILLQFAHSLPHLHPLKVTLESLRRVRVNTEAAWTFGAHVAWLARPLLRVKLVHGK